MAVWKYTVLVNTLPLFSIKLQSFNIFAIPLFLSSLRSPTVVQSSFPVPVSYLISFKCLSRRSKLLGQSLLPLTFAFPGFFKLFQHHRIEFLPSIEIQMMPCVLDDDYFGTAILSLFLYF